MDIYSNLRIPFNAGVWLRTHKFNPLAVRVSQSLKSIADLDQQIADIEARRAAEEHKLARMMDQVSEELEGSKNGY